MFHKALWMKEYQQGKWLLWSLSVLGALIIFLERLNQMENVRQISSYHFVPKPDILSLLFPPGLKIPYLLIMLLILACFYFGFERRNGAQDFTFSLPFSRTSIFVVKWTLPVLFLTGTYILCGLLDLVVISFSEFHEYLYVEQFATKFWINHLLINYLLLLALYSMVVFIGTITGTAFIQAVVSFMVFFLPILSFDLLRIFFDYFGGVSLFESTNKILEFFFLIYVDQNHDGWVLIPIIPIFFWSAKYSFSKNKVEKNGKVFLFKSWEIFFRVVLTLFATLGFASLSITFIHFQDVNNIRIFYFFMLVIALLLSYFLMKLLMGKRLKI